MKQIEFGDPIVYLKERIVYNASVDHSEFQKSRLKRIITNTIETGESDFAIIVDTTKSVRNSLVDSIVNEVAKDKRFEGDYCVIKLHGNIHTTDDLAFREIARHINIECPDEASISGSFVDRIIYVLESLRTANKSVSLILVIKGFHHFCSHENQTLIYNLFDLVHRKAPICFIGVSYETLSLEKLGKREFSRFSDKVMHIHCTDMFQRNVKNFQTYLSVNDSRIDEKFSIIWNKNIDMLCSDPSVLGVIEKLSDQRICEDQFRDFLYFVLCSCDSEHRYLTKEDITEAAESFLPSNVSKLLDDLSSAELALIISICHNCEILNQPTFNFKVIYDRYSKVVDTCSSIPKMKQYRAEKAFEYFAKSGLIKPSKSESLDSQEYRTYAFDLLPEDVKDYVKNNPKIPEDMKRWMDDSLIGD